METGDTKDGRQPAKKQLNVSSSEDVLRALKRRSKEDLLRVLEGLQKEIIKLNTELARSLKERDESRRVIEKYDAKLARLKDEIYKLRDEIEDRESENEELREKIKKLKKGPKVDDAKCGSDCVCDHEQDCEHREKENKEKEKAKSEKQDETEFQQVLDDMTEECEVQQERIETLEQEIEDRDAIIEEMKTQVEELERQLQEMEDKLENQGCDKTVEDLQFSVDDKEFQIEDLTKEKEHLMNRIADLEAFIAEQDLEIPVDDIEGVSPRSANSALRILKTQYLRLRNQHCDIEKEYAQLQEENNALKSELHKNPSSDVESQTEVKSTVSERSVREIQTDPEATDGRSSELQEELNLSKKQVDELTALKNELAQERASMMEYVRLARSASTDLEKKNNELDKKLQATAEENMQLQRKVKDLQTELRGLKDAPTKPTATDSLRDRINIKVQDLVKFHESKFEDTIFRNRITKQPKAASEGMPWEDSFTQRGNVQSSPALNTIIQNEPKDKNMFFCDGNYESVANALSSLKESAEKLEQENQKLLVELQDTRQKHEWQLNLVELQLGRAELLYKVAQEENQQLITQLNERSGNAYKLSCYYQELVNEIEYDKEKMQQENRALIRELVKVQDTRENNKTKERKILNEEYNDSVQRENHELKEMQDINEQLVNQVSELRQIVEKQNDEIGDLEDVLHEHEKHNRQREAKRFQRKMQTGDNRPKPPKWRVGRTMSTSDVEYYSPIPARFREGQTA